METAIDVSVVIPVFNSESTLHALYERLKAVLDGVALSWEAIFVDDGSSDSSCRVLQALRDSDGRVRVVRLVRNHGQQHAVLCGLNYAKGAYVITLDDDLQNPPEEIPKFVAGLREGHLAVIGRIAEGEKNHRWWRNLGSSMNQYLAGRILGKPRDLYLSSYRGLSRHAVDRIIAYKGAHPHIAALLLKALPTRSIVNVDVAHAPRADGRSSTYSLPKLVKTASYLLVNHSYLPLRFMIGWGMLLSLASLSFAFWVAARALLFGHSVVGWASLAVLVAFLSGNILLALGIVGEYLGRLVEEFSTVDQFAVLEEDV